MRLLIVALCAMGMTGCGKSPPTLAGGKPVSHWIEAAQHPDAETRRQALFKLGNAGPADAEVLPTLMRALGDVVPGVRSEAILALVKMGPQAKKAIAVLTEMREQDSDGTVRSHAAKAVEMIQNGHSAGN
jgi:HEAT repeat protein